MSDSTHKVADLEGLKRAKADTEAKYARNEAHLASKRSADDQTAGKSEAEKTDDKSLLDAVKNVGDALDFGGPGGKK